jgi:ADP-heptose:LPS heptosyltransferase
LKKGTEKLYTHTIQKLDSEKNHVIDRVMAFSQLFGLQTLPNNYNIVFRPTEKSLEKSKKIIEEHFSQEKFLLGINISAGSEARFWGIENYSELISSIIDYKVNVLLMCAEHDLEYAQTISKGSIPIFYNHDFNEFSAMIYYLDLLFTPDTSIVHIGSAFHKPVFGLYVKYNTNDMIWSPYKSPFDCVITEEPTLKNVKLESVKEKFIPFFEKFYYEYSTKQE